jgi:flagellar hook-length control protein FliK
MSVSAALTDLGSVASARTAQPSSVRPGRSGAEKDDAFGQMVREAARERSDPPGRNDEWLASRPRHERLPTDDHHPRPEKSDLPAAALEHRSENARRGGGPRDKTETRPSNDDASPGKPTEDLAETPPAHPVEQPVEQCGTTDVPSQGSDASGAGPDKAKKADAQAPQVLPQPAVEAATATALNQAIAPPVVPAPITPAGPVVDNAAVAAVAAAPTPTTVPAGTAADPAAVAAAAQTLAEAAPAIVAGPADATTEATPTVEVAGATAAAVKPDGAPQTQPGKRTAAADGETQSTAQSGAKTASSDGVTDPVTQPGDRKAPSDAVTGPVTQTGEKKAKGDDMTDPAAQPGAHKDEAQSQAAGAGKAPSTGANAAAPTAQPQASPALEALRSAVADAQPQANASPNTGLVQAAGPAAGTDPRTIVTLPAMQRSEMPVPLQAVAIEIGMRAMRGAKEFAIRLDPEDLGRIDVKLEVSEAGQVQARVVVEKVETLQLLQRDARTLERAFDQAGLKTTPDGLQFSLRDPGGQGRNGDDQPSRDGSRGRMAEEPVIDEIRLQPAHYRLAASGGLDIRI